MFLYYYLVLTHLILIDIYKINLLSLDSFQIEMSCVAEYHLSFVFNMRLNFAHKGNNSISQEGLTFGNIEYNVCKSFILFFFNISLFLSFFFFIYHIMVFVYSSISIGVTIFI